MCESTKWKYSFLCIVKQEYKIHIFPNKHKSVLLEYYANNMISSNKYYNFRKILYLNKSYNPHEQLADSPYYDLKCLSY